MNGFIKDALRWMFSWKLAACSSRCSSVCRCRWGRGFPRWFPRNTRLNPSCWRPRITRTLWLWTHARWVSNTPAAVDPSTQRSPRVSSAAGWEACPTIACCVRRVSRCHFYPWIAAPLMCNGFRRATVARCSCISTVSHRLFAMTASPNHSWAPSRSAASRTTEANSLRCLSVWTKETSPLRCLSVWTKETSPLRCLSVWLKETSPLRCLSVWLKETSPLWCLSVWLKETSPLWCLSVWLKETSPLRCLSVWLKETSPLWCLSVWLKETSPLRCLSVWLKETSPLWCLSVWLKETSPLWCLSVWLKETSPLRCLSDQTPASTTFPADAAWWRISAARLLRRTARGSSSWAARRMDTGAARICAPPRLPRSPVRLGPPARRCTLTALYRPLSISLWIDSHSSLLRFPPPPTGRRKHRLTSEEEKNLNRNYESCLFRDLTSNLEILTINRTLITINRND